MTLHASQLNPIYTKLANFKLLTLGLQRSQWHSLGSYFLTLLLKV